MLVAILILIILVILILLPQVMIILLPQQVIHILLQVMINEEGARHKLVPSASWWIKWDLKMMVDMLMYFIWLCRIRESFLMWCFWVFKSRWCPRVRSRWCPRASWWLKWGRRIDQTAVDNHWPTKAASFWSDCTNISKPSELNSDDQSLRWDQMNIWN